MNTFLRVLVIAILAVPGGLPAVSAQGEPVILSVDGGVADGAVHEFTRSQLEALGHAEIDTTTPWHDGVIRFEGVPLALLMEHVGAKGRIAAVRALNNYKTEVPLTDFSQFGVILALKKNGEYMPVSDKGPLFIVYPFDSNEMLNGEVYYSRSAWQVRRITIE